MFFKIFAPTAFDLLRQPLGNILQHTVTCYIIIASCDNFGLGFRKQQFWEQPEAP